MMEVVSRELDYTLYDASVLFCKIGASSVSTVIDVPAGITYIPVRVDIRYATQADTKVRKAVKG